MNWGAVSGLHSLVRAVEEADGARAATGETVGYTENLLYIRFVTYFC